MAGVADRLRDYARLFRIEHAFMLAFAVFIAETVALGHMPQFSLAVVLSLLVPFLIEMGSFADNDYIDIDADTANRRRDRPLVKGTIVPSTAFHLAIACYALGVLLALFINPACFVIALVFAALAALYNRKLKDIALLGNVYIAGTMAIPFIFGNFVVAPTLHPISLALAALAFLGGFGREIVKSIEDMEGDRLARKSRTIPLIIGPWLSASLASFIYADFIFFTFVPFYFGLKLSHMPLLVVLVADVAFLYMAFRLPFNQSKEFLAQCRKTSLAAMAIGLIGIFLAAIL